MPFRAPQFVRSNESSLFAVIGCRCRPCAGDRKSTRLNSSHSQISYAVFCLKKKILLHLPLAFHHRSLRKISLCPSALPDTFYLHTRNTNLAILPGRLYLDSRSYKRRTSLLP